MKQLSSSHRCVHAMKEWLYEAISKDNFCVRYVTLTIFLSLLQMRVVLKGVNTVPEAVPV